MELNRFLHNPVIFPEAKNSWEAEATFNSSVIKDNGTYHAVYRAISSTDKISTIGYGESADGINFKNRRQLIKPEYDWEKFGCEDPRVTKLDDKYFIFYTALSTFPFTPSGIKIGVAVTRDFTKIEEKHPVTFFNSKAMALFPERINGKIAGILTANTDNPPAKIGIIFFDQESQIWSKEYWEEWFYNLDSHVIQLQRSPKDHIEVGAPPVKTDKGWLFIYCYIKDYLSSSKVFGIEAVLLDLKNPFKILGRTKDPLLVPEKYYELYGNVHNVIFPTGALINQDQLFIYYGAADTTCCLATCELKTLLNLLETSSLNYFQISNKDNYNPLTAKSGLCKLERFEGNPVLKPIQGHQWEAQAAFNPTAIYLDKKVHIIYRAMDNQGTSVLGYASSKDGFNIDERLNTPIYVPREPFEKRITLGNSGCEDPRITKLENKLYMLYTAFDAQGPTRVALTSIEIEDFLNKRWEWSTPILLSPPKIDHKNTCVLSEKINGKYVILHRVDPSIWIDSVDDLSFTGKKWVEGTILFKPRTYNWDSEKIGIGPAPIKTKDGWLLIYHGLSSHDKKYRLGAALLKLDNPGCVLSRLAYPILEPEVDYENRGIRPGTVFTCGAAVINEKLFIYYGGADQVVCVASVDLEMILKALSF